MKDLYIFNRGQKLKCGFTTGSCATAASKAAALMLQNQSLVAEIKLETPAEITLTLPVQNPSYDATTASCHIIKDAGDDHDATDGIEVHATVSKREDGKIVIQGGNGIGTISKPGFWGKTGDPAINPVPRQMIQKELSAIADCGWTVVLSIPGGAEIAQHTFNAKIGIKGGLSIIGTSGIVEPMSVEALKQTIYLEIDDIANSGATEILLVLGNYGKQLAESQGIKMPLVKISNFIGDAVLYCKNKEFKKVLLIGHIGKLCKLSVGAFYTHSSVCDLRVEAFVYYLALAGASRELIGRVVEASDTEAVLDIVSEAGYSEIVADMRQGCLERIRRYVKDPDFNIDVFIYSMAQGLLNKP